MAQSRQLAAIMFTDIVGYTTLMGMDELKAFEILNKNRNIQRPCIEQYQGRWIKEIGDGVLASFNTVTDAVNAAIKIQEECHKANDFVLRIGIHLGEVVFELDDVFGDTVNIAARIQAMAEPGGIFISESVYNNISNKQEVNTRFVKQEILKNVKDPIRIYEIVHIASIGASSTSNQQQTIKSAEKSIAVLAFTNMSNDPDQEYFSDGISEDILNSLVKLKGLRVSSRTSSFFFKGKNVDLKEIGEKLKVNTVLEGSVRKQGNRLRITAQLINISDGFHLRSEKYDRNIEDIFAIQDEIALMVTEQLKITLFGDEREAITKVTTQNAEAYELVLKGRFHINRRGSSILKGLEFFKQAIALDPTYAQGHSGYSWANYITAVYFFSSGISVMKSMKESAETSILLDNTLDEGYFAMAHYHVIERNWKEAKKYFYKAIEHNSKFAQAYSLFGMYLAFIEGNFDEAEKHGRIAIKLEPLSAIDHADLSWTLHTAHKFEEGLEEAKTGIELDANSFLSHRLAGLNYIGLNLFKKAIETLEYLVNVSNRQQHALTALIWAYCGDGKFNEARKLMEELNYKSKTEYVGGTYAGISAACLGEFDLAFEYLEKAFNDHDPLLAQIKYFPTVPESFKKDKRFLNLIERIGYP